MDVTCLPIYLSISLPDYLSNHTGPSKNHKARHNVYTIYRLIPVKLYVSCLCWPVTGTNTVVGWATDPNDDSAGRRFLRLGQDLPLYATTLKVTASVTKLKFLVSPENSYAEFYA